MNKFEVTSQNNPSSYPHLCSGISIADTELQAPQMASTPAQRSSDGTYIGFGSNAWARSTDCSRPALLPASTELKVRAPELHPTRHASKRQQQRCIPFETLRLLQQFGREVHDQRGAYWLIFDRLGRQRVRQTLGKAAAQIKLDVFAVVDATQRSQVITVGHRTKRLKTNGSNESRRPPNQNCHRKKRLKAKAQI